MLSAMRKMLSAVANNCLSLAAESNSAFGLGLISGKDFSNKQANQIPESSGNLKDLSLGIFTVFILFNAT